MKRAKILHGIDELRAVSHVIDMHQLTKDPSQMLAAGGKRTKSSPQANTDSLSAGSLSGLLQRIVVAHWQAGRPVRAEHLRQCGFAGRERYRDADERH